MDPYSQSLSPWPTMSNLSIALLLLEDDDAQLEKIKFGFRQLYPNSSISYAKDGWEFIKLLKHLQGRQKIDLTILDINVPPPDGIEILRRLGLRTPDNPGGCTIPTVMFTTGASREDRELCLSLGAKAVVFKPGFDRFNKALQEIVEEYVRNRPLGDAINDTLTGIDIEAEKQKMGESSSTKSVDELLEDW